MSAVVDFPVRSEARPYLDAFGRVASSQRKDEPGWLARYREASLARFAELGFPSRRNEAWRYLDLRDLERKPMLPVCALRPVIGASVRAQLAEMGLSGASHRLVLVDGRFAPELSAIADLPAGVWFGSMAAAVGERPDLVRPGFEATLFDAHRPMAALNAAFFADGFALDIAAGITLDRPVEILHLSSGETGGSLHTRSLIAAGRGSRGSVVESFAGLGNYWRNDVVDLRLAAGAELSRTALIEEGAEALHFAEMTAALGQAARLSSFVLLLGGRTVRCDAAVRCGSEKTRCELNGAFLLSGRQEANILTTVDHAAPGGETRETFKGVVTGRAHGAFQGRITVHPGAQKVDAHQLSRNLVLGPHAAVDAKPELEIFADDVKCSHGAAIGDLDEGALFYLRTRGIPDKEARRMLIEAFVREAVELVDFPLVREHLLSRITRRLAILEE
jgi:Fe-S cluster assembly protein SufD